MKENCYNFYFFVLEENFGKELVSSAAADSVVLFLALNFRLDSTCFTLISDVVFADEFHIFALKEYLYMKNRSARRLFEGLYDVDKHIVIVK